MSDTGISLQPSPSTAASPQKQTSAHPFPSSGSSPPQLIPTDHSHAQGRRPIEAAAAGEEGTGQSKVHSLAPSAATATTDPAKAPAELDSTLDGAAEPNTLERAIEVSLGPRATLDDDGDKAERQPHTGLAPPSGPCRDLVRGQNAVSARTQAQEPPSRSLGPQSTDHSRRRALRPSETGSAARSRRSSRGALAPGPTMPPPDGRSVSREREREREAARRAETELWERTRGAGSSVLDFPGSQKTVGEASRMTARDILPSLADIEGKLFDPVEAPSRDQLLVSGIADYTILPKVLGKGKFSTVFIASKNGELSAIKHTALFPHHQLIATRLLREPTLLAELPPHPNLVEVKETIQTEGHFYLVEEYLDGYVTLEALLQNFRASPSHAALLPLEIADKVLSQLLSAVRAVHHPLQICHRDIKPENILVHEKSLHLKLLDFGLATHFSRSEPKLTTCCGSPAFHCPEIVKALASSPGSVSYWGPEVDAWTCGVTMLRVLTGVRYPLGSSHASLRSMAIRAQRAVAQIPLSDRPGGDEQLGLQLRAKVAKLLDMDAKKRMRYLEELAAETNGERTSEAGPKTFKSTTFIPAPASHKMDLPLLTPAGTQALQLGGDRDRSTSFRETISRGSTGPVAPSSRWTTPLSSRATSPVKEAGTLVEEAEDGSGLTEGVAPSTSGLSSLEAKPRLVMLNPTRQPPPRVLSYIKYCLRCAGILYHGWADEHGPSARSSVPAVMPGRSTTSDTPKPSATSPHTTAEDRDDGWAQVHIFQCVIELKAIEQKAHELASPARSFVHSIMAAFGRRKSELNGTNRQAESPLRKEAGAASASYSRNNTTGPLGANRQGTSGAPQPPKYLSFYIVVKFPRHVRSNSRPPHSRANTGTGRRSRAVSAAQVPGSTQRAVPGSTLAEQMARRKSDEVGGDATSMFFPALGSAELSMPRLEALAHQTDHLRQTLLSTTGQPSPSRRNDRTLATSNNTMPKSHGRLSIDTRIGTLDGSELQGDRATPAYEFPPLSRPADQVRALKGNVLIEISDPRAFDTVKAALAVGGIQDPPESEPAIPPPPPLRRSMSSFGSAMAQSEQARERTGRSGQLPPRKVGTRSQSYFGPRSSQMQVSQAEPAPVPSKHAMADSATVPSHSGDRNTTCASPAAVAEPSITRSPNLECSDTKPMIPDDSADGRPATIQEQSNESVKCGDMQGDRRLNGNQPNADQSKSTSSDCNLFDGTSSQTDDHRIAADLTALQKTIDQLLTGLAAQHNDTDDSRHSTALLHQLASDFDTVRKHLSCVSAVSGGTGFWDRYLFQLFAALSPLTGVIRDLEVSARAAECLSRLASNANAKELFLAVQERLELIAHGPASLPTAKVDRANTAADEHADFASRDWPPIWRCSGEVVCLLKVLDRVLIRINTKKPVLFLRGMNRIIAQSVNIAARDVDTDDGFDNLTTSSIALAHSMMQWAGCERTEAHDLIADLLITSLAAIMQHAHTVGAGTESLAESKFYSQNPRYRVRNGAVIRGTDASARRHQAVRQAFASMSINVANLAFDTESRTLAADGQPGMDSNQGVSNLQLPLQLDAFLLDSICYMRDEQMPISHYDYDKLIQTIRRSLPILLACLGYVSSTTVNPPSHPNTTMPEVSSRELLLADVSLLLLLHYAEALRAFSHRAAVDRAGLGSLPVDVLHPLASALATHAALSPRPTHRHISLQLLGVALSEWTPGEKDMVEWLQDLISDSPWMQLRVGSVALAKDALTQRLDRRPPDVETTKIWQNLLVAHTFILPEGKGALPPWDQVDSAIVDAWLATRGAWLTQVLSLAFLLLKRRPASQWLLSDGIVEGALAENLLGPLKKLLATCPATGQGASEGRSPHVTPSFDRGLVIEAVARVEDAMDSAKTRAPGCET
ncbi:unnamed protein product [Parajaminaea phylloscopi]